jgi:hypothetical protein
MFIAQLAVGRINISFVWNCFAFAGSAYSALSVQLRVYLSIRDMFGFNRKRIRSAGAHNNDSVRNIASTNEKTVNYEFSLYMCFKL